MLEIDISSEARAFLRTLPEKHERQLITRIDRLAENPFIPKSKLLEGYAPLRRLRSGDYRIIYFVTGNVLKVPLIDKRGDDKVYRRLKQLFG
ncbi:MAG: type II toxin-antitoxin system RelE/ParE family toxin [bacterium]|nr:type II toxin-antitoxin system RelE/ParE family toxin [bacterium]